MNKEKVMGIIRHVLTFGGGYVVAKGFIDEGTMMEIVGAVSTIVGIAWSYFAPEKA